MHMALEARIRELEEQLARVTHERDEYRKLYELVSLELERFRRHIFGQKAERVDAGPPPPAADAAAGGNARPDAGSTGPGAIGTPQRGASAERGGSARRRAEGQKDHSPRAPEAPGASARRAGRDPACRGAR
jgi:hypothetical protein